MQLRDMEEKEEEEKKTAAYCKRDTFVVRLSLL